MLPKYVRAKSSMAVRFPSVGKRKYPMTPRITRIAIAAITATVFAVEIEPVIPPAFS